MSTTPLQEPPMIIGYAPSAINVWPLPPQQSLRDLPTAIETPTTALAKVDVKAVALSRFGNWRAAAAALVAKFDKVAFDVRSTKGYDEAKKALAEVRAPRYAAQNVAKDSKSELAAVSKAVGVEELAVTEFLAATEKHIKDQIDAEDKRREEEKQARLQREAAEAAERARVEAARIANYVVGIKRIRDYLVAAAGQPSEALERGIVRLEGMTFGETWQEYADQAQAARDETLEALRRMHAAALVAEQQAAAAEEQRLQNERLAAELAAMKAAQAQAQAQAPEAAQRPTEDRHPDAEALPPAALEPTTTPAPQPVSTPAPVQQIPPQRRTTGLRRSAPAPFAHQSDESHALRRAAATDLGLRFGAAHGDDGWCFKTEALVDLIQYVLASTRSA